MKAYLDALYQEMGTLFSIELKTDWLHNYMPLLLRKVAPGFRIIAQSKETLLAAQNTVYTVMSVALDTVAVSQSACKMLRDIVVTEETKARLSGINLAPPCTHQRVQSTQGLKAPLEALMLESVGCVGEAGAFFPVHHWPNVLLSYKNVRDRLQCEEQTTEWSFVVPEASAESLETALAHLQDFSAGKPAFRSALAAALPAQRMDFGCQRDRGHSGAPDPIDQTCTPAVLRLRFSTPPEATTFAQLARRNGLIRLEERTCLVIHNCDGYPLFKKGICAMATTCGTVFVINGMRPAPFLI